MTDWYAIGAVVLIVFVYFNYKLYHYGFYRGYKHKTGQCPHKWVLHNEYKRTTISNNNQVMVIVDRCKYCGELKETEI